MCPSRAHAELPATAGGSLGRPDTTDDTEDDAGAADSVPVGPVSPLPHATADVSPATQRPPFILFLGVDIDRPSNRPGSVAPQPSIFSTVQPGIIR